jgi:hypothetical protein
MEYDVCICKNDSKFGAPNFNLHKVGRGEVPN